MRVMRVGRVVLIRVFRLAALRRAVFYLVERDFRLAGFGVFAAAAGDEARDIPKAGESSRELSMNVGVSPTRTAPSFEDPKTHASGWMTPAEPLLHPSGHSAEWAHALAILRHRAD